MQSAQVQAFGRILEGPGHHTLYVFCYEHSVYQESCARRRSIKYLPLIAHGRVVAAYGSKIKQPKLRTRKLRTGQRQVTYYGQPLYLYQGDRKPGQFHAGGGWWPIKTDGQMASGSY